MGSGPDNDVDVDVDVFVVAIMGVGEDEYSQWVLERTVVGDVCGGCNDEVIVVVIGGGKADPERFGLAARELATSSKFFISEIKFACSASSSLELPSS